MRVLTLTSSVLWILLQQCHTSLAQSSESKSTSLLSKSIVTPTDVSEQAHLALDIRDITELLAQGDFLSARMIYMDGRNSLLYDEQGNLLEGKRTLESLSLDSLEGVFDNDPSFMFHTYGLSPLATAPMPQAGKEPLRLAYTYANDFTGDLLADNLSETMAAESMTALNLWMYVTHELWESIADCADTTFNRLDDFTREHENAKGSRSFDEAIAYWIGEDQTNGHTDGYALYALTQKAGAFFGTADPEATANTNIKRLYEEGRAVLSMQDACMPNSRAVEQLWHIVNHMISQMMVPLIQMLIRALKEHDLYRIQLYSIAIVPQMSACKASTYRFLKAELLDNPYQTSSYEKVLAMLQSSYECLGITCEDIGAYGTAVPQCKPGPNDSHIAGYTPTTDVKPYSQIDLDIFQLHILTLVETYNMAFLLYVFGKNVHFDEDDNHDSLQLLATQPDRRSVLPWFLEFEDYFNDQNYADAIIVDTLLGQGKWGDKSPDQRSAMVTGTAQYQIMYMAVLTCMQMASQSCDQGDLDQSALMWDKAAAYMIGSIEGHNEGGANISDGKLLWNLANAMCTQFGTCNSDGFSVINAELEDLLYAGKGQLSSSDCPNVLHTIHKMQHIMLIPLIQGVLRFAMKNEIHSVTSGDADLATGEALALSVLPVVAYYDVDAAKHIEKNMIISDGVKPASSGAASVGDAFFSIMDEFGLKCDYVGNFGKVDACVGEGGASPAPTTRNLELIKNIILFAVAAVFVGGGAMEL